MNSPSESTALRPTDSIARLIELIGSSAQQLLEAGEMLARLVAHDATIIAKIQEHAPTLPPSFLTKLLRIGEHSLHPELIFNGCLAYRQLARLPYSAQARALEAKTVELVIDIETGDVIKVPLTELDRNQVKQVITSDGIRSRDEQRRYLRAAISGRRSRRERLGFQILSVINSELAGYVEKVPSLGDAAGHIHVRIMSLLKEIEA